MEEDLLDQNQEGLFFSDGEHSFALMSSSAFASEMRQKLFHEFTHYLMSASASLHEYPLWYAEGLAEMLSSVIWKEGVAIVGLPPARMASARAFGRWISLPRLLSLRSTSGMSVEEGSLFYAEAWALVHYLHTSRRSDGGSRLAQLLDYLARVRSGSRWEEALDRAFAMKPLDLEAELRAHWEESQRTVRVLKIPAAGMQPAADREPRQLSQLESQAALEEAGRALRGFRDSRTGPFDLPFDLGPVENPFEVQPPEPVDGE